MSSQTAKRDKLGIFSKTELSCLDLLEHVITAALSQKQSKLTYLEKAQIKTEIIKHLIRTSHEINSLNDKKYLEISEMLVEISKMISGWMKYLAQKDSP